MPLKALFLVCLGILNRTEKHKKDIKGKKKNMYLIISNDQELVGAIRSLKFHLKDEHGMSILYECRLKQYSMQL